MTHKHTCKDCGKEFEVDQDSRRQYCDECTVKRVVEGGTRTPPERKEEQ